MKLATLAPWALLAIVLAYPLFAQGSMTKTRLSGGPVKILGQPAASEWSDSDSGQDGQPETQFSVPPGKVLTLMYEHLRPTAGGAVAGTVSIDGVIVATISVSHVALHPLHSGSIPEPCTQGEIAREGQLVILTRPSETAAQEVTFIVRGWLEDIR